MALTLDPTLAAAQDSQSRHPLIEIVSESAIADIPFDGSDLTADSSFEPKSNAILHSSGRFCGIYKSAAGAFIFLYTDPARTEFFSVDIPLPASYVSVEGSLCEMSGGNVGLILKGTYSGSEKLRHMVVSPVGATVTAQAELATWTTADHVISSPFVIKLSGGTYFLIYIDKTVSGATYAIRKRTSSDFSSWSAEGSCSIGGLTATRAIYECSLLEDTTGQLWCWFSYVTSVSGSSELVNIYYSVSSDSGATWSSAANWTNYVTYDKVARHPRALQKIAAQMHVLFHDVSSIRRIDKNTTGYCYSSTIHELNAVGMTFDPVTRKLYLVNTRGRPDAPIPVRTFSSILRIDVDTWSIDACWNDTSVPAIGGSGSAFASPGPFGAEVWGERNHGERHLIPIASNCYANKLHVGILNGEEDTFTEFHFNAETGIAQNVTWTPPANTEIFLSDTWVDYDSNRLYCVIVSKYFSTSATITIGYIDLSQTGPTYAFTLLFADVISGSDGISQYNLIKSEGAGSAFFLPDDLLMVAAGVGGNYVGSSSSLGALRIYTLSTPALYKVYRQTTVAQFPYNGVGIPLYIGGKIYAGFHWNSDAEIPGEGWKKGLCIIDIITDSVTYSQPGWATLDEYHLWVLRKISATGICMLSRFHGVTSFNISEATWVLYDNSTVAGLDTSANYKFWEMALDLAGENIFIDSYGAAGYLLAAFPLAGIYKQAKYRIGTYSGSWSWGSILDLVQGVFDYDLSAGIHSSNIYALWTRGNATAFHLKWDKEGSSLDLSPYLLRSKEITCSWSIDGAANGLDFEVSHGHLFDPQNSKSLLSIYLRKGRRLAVRMGEKISGTDYWQAQGTFFVTEGVIEYERRKYPSMRIRAEDIRHSWDESLIVATEYYQAQPKEIIEDILTGQAGLSLSDTNIPIFNDSTILYHQWIETSIKQVLDQIAERFGYFLRIEVDGKVGCRPISDGNPVDHVYSGLGWLVNYSPDDTYSRNVNRIIVSGKLRTPTTVLFAEEPVGQVDGTVGWWGGKKEIEFWFSVDHSRRCTNPRLQVSISVKNFNFRLGGGGESITSIRSDKLGCTITVDVPNMVPALVALLVAIVATAIACSFCDSFMLKPGWCGVCMVILMTMISTMIGIVASVASYRYEVFAQPYGEVYQTVQAAWDDDENQAYVGRQIPQKIDDPLCYSVQHCQQVADQEGLISRLDRSRVKIIKTAHLQDEIGDTIQFNHPYSGLSLRFFITKLTRKMLIPDMKSRKHGYFLDEIEGWKL